MAPNRVVAIMAAVLTLVLGVLPIIANMDATSTAGIVAAIVGVLGVVVKWLDGWQLYEEREALPLDPVPTLPDRGDAGVPNP